MENLTIIEGTESKICGVTYVDVIRKRPYNPSSEGKEVIKCTMRKTSAKLEARLIQLVITGKKLLEVIDLIDEDCWEREKENLIQ